MRQRQRLKSVILPAEHGSWAFWLEPTLLGLLLAPTAIAAWLALSATAVFLSRQPLKLWLLARQNGRFTPKTALAQRATLLFGSIVLLSFIVALLLKPPLVFLLPLLIAAPFGLFALAYDVHQTRSWQAELSAPIALTAVLPTILLANSWPLIPALILWAVLILRSLSSIVYVRAYLRRIKGKAFSWWKVTAVHLLALGLIIFWVSQSHLPTIITTIFTFFLLRATIMLSPWAKPLPAKIIGIAEMVFGLLLVALLAYLLIAVQ